MALKDAKKEVVLITASGTVTKLGRDRLAELDEWAFGIANTYAPEKVDGRTEWRCEGDEVRFMKFAPSFDDNAVGC